MTTAKSWTTAQCQAIKTQVDESVALARKLEDKLKLVIVPIGESGTSGMSGMTGMPSPLFLILTSIQNTLKEHNTLLESLLNRIDI
jgi:hypothetical protein